MPTKLTGTIPQPVAVSVEYGGVGQEMPNASWLWTAAQIAEERAPGAKSFRPDKALTSLCEWFATKEALVTVLPPNGRVDAVDRVLPYALAWQQDRDLIVIAPRMAVGTTLERLAWIQTPVAVFTYDENVLVEAAVIPARAEVLAAARERRPRLTAAHDVADSRNLVAALLDWADGHWALSRASRASYLAWHCLGRQVLAIRRTDGGIRVTAGVKHVGAGSTSDGVFDEPLTESVSAVQRSLIEAAVAAAVADRYTGVDAGHVEHRMQGALAASRLAPLGVDRFVREYPAWRGLGRQGFIDFLGVDRRNRLHVVETKVGTDDPGVVLQTVDYATWVRANATEIRDNLGWPMHGGNDEPVIDIVLAPKQAGGQAIGPYLAGQLEALSRDLYWRVYVIVDPRSEVLEVLGPLDCLPMPDTLPGVRVASPVVRPRWPARAAAELAQKAT
ncbi:MAG: hypothetical protein ACRDRT_02330 [Pseudonocardiaceae bacterium]